jgi:hypothetical protein
MRTNATTYGLSPLKTKAGSSQMPELAVDLTVAFAKGGGCDPKDGPFISKKSDYYNEPSVTTAAHPPAVVLID